MTKSLLALVAACALALTACSDKKSPKNSVEEGKANIEALDATNKNLAYNYGIVLNPMFATDMTEKAKEYDWSKWSAASQTAIRGMLNNQIARCGKIETISKRDGVIATGMENVARVKSNAAKFLRSLDNYQLNLSKKAG